MTAHTVDRKNQRYIRRGRRELTGRLWKVNENRTTLKRPGTMRHRWSCPGCGMTNDPRHLSCRYCPTLKWGVAP